MIRFALRRLATAIPLLWLVWTVTFAIGRLAPGDPMALYEGSLVPADAIERLRHIYGLDAPLPVQYVKQLGATLRGDLALSTSEGRPVGTIIAEAIGPTLLLTGTALVLTFLIGGGVGFLSTRTADSGFDQVATGTSLFLYSMPSFWIGVELVQIFSFRLGWLPSSHMASIVSPGGVIGSMGDAVLHLVLPVTTLVLGSAAVVARHMRSGLLEALASPFVRSARARGLSEWRIIGRHALRHALRPLITLIGLSLPVLLSGTVLVEVIFAWPGLGRVAYNAIVARDYPLVQATTLMTATLVIIGSLLADLLAAALDPRIRLAEEQT
ncbi:MAG: ABC transporter permease [Acidobacteriota bacterium]